MIQINGGGAPPPAPILHPYGGGALAKPVIALVQKEPIALAAKGGLVNGRDIPIQPPIIVQIGNSRTHAIGRHLDTGGFALV